MSFVKSLKRIINSKQARSVVLTGNVYDLFFDGKSYVPLMPFLKSQCQAEATAGAKGITQVLFELDHPIEVIGKGYEEFKSIWESLNPKLPLEERISDSAGNETYALGLLRNMTECNRTAKNSTNNLLVMIESADMLLPEGEIGRMSLTDRKRVAIVQDWLSSPEFMAAGDCVILVSESRSSLHSRIARLPQVLSVDIPLPNMADRLGFIDWFRKQLSEVDALFVGLNPTTIAEQTSGLSIHAIRQLLLSGDLSAANITSKVEEYMIGQLGEGVVEFQRPTHKLEDLIGFRKIKQFVTEELIPGFMDGSVGGAVFSGPIGGGKTHICAAIASALGIPVILLKNIRSKWYGETDQIFERLKRLLESFSKVMIFVDEADTQFGDVDGDDGGTEKRLTGKIQAMMSDESLKGRVIWFLMTARIHRLSADIRRPGRMDLIIPILDPEGDDRDDFVRWTFGNIDVNPHDKVVYDVVKGYSSATFAALRKRIKSKKCETIEQALKVASNILQPDIEETRRYQTLQALLNCTVKSLIFEEDETLEKVKSSRSQWKKDLAALEAQGID